MPDPEMVLIAGGRRQGRTLANERDMRAALAEGRLVFTRLNGIFFAVSIGEEGEVVYTAQERKPEGL